VSKINFNLKFGSVANLSRKMRTALKLEMDEYFDGAVRAFIDGVLDDTSSAQKGDGKIETGMSMASLLPLAMKVNYENEVRQEIHQGRRLNFKKGLTTLRGEWRKDRERSIFEGISAGENAFVFKKNYNSGTMKFSFKIMVFQHKHWEEKKESLVKGREAMLEYMDTHKSELTQNLGRVYRRITGSYFRGN